MPAAKRKKANSEGSEVVLQRIDLEPASLEKLVKFVTTVAATGEGFDVESAQFQTVRRSSPSASGDSWLASADFQDVSRAGAERIAAKASSLDFVAAWNDLVTVLRKTELPVEIRDVQIRRVGIRSGRKASETLRVGYTVDLSLRTTSMTAGVALEAAFREKSKHFTAQTASKAEGTSDRGRLFGILMTLDPRPEAPAPSE